jgi:hypothetical protein
MVMAEISQLYNASAAPLLVGLPHAMAKLAFGSAYDAGAAPISQVLTVPIVDHVLGLIEDAAVLETISAAMLMQAIINLYQILQLQTVSAALGPTAAGELGLFVALSAAERRTRWVSHVWCACNIFCTEMAQLSCLLESRPSILA